MDFLLYEPEDFAADESYLRYYFRINEADIIFWQEWISNHPERLDIVINADQLINFLYFQLPKEELEKEYQRIMDSISRPEQYKKEFVPIRETVQDTELNPREYRILPENIALKRRRLFLRLSVAASLLFLVTLCTYFFFLSKTPVPFENFSQASGMQQKINTSEEPVSVILSDGSIVTLQPGAQVSYPLNFSAAKREVFLEGEAFFNVSKDASRSFYVYYRNLVTHVLGTSFNVKIDKTKRQVEVSVRTGRVEVYEKSALSGSGNNKNGNGVVLTPNQKVVYSESNKRFDASIVDIPLPIPTRAHAEAVEDSVAIPPVIYNAVPLGTILDSLEIMYGVEIEVEDDNISNCHFSGDISDMNLYVKLDIICQALNASYEKKGTTIIVRGKGCM